MKDTETTHFGYQDVAKHEKANKVAEVFSRVAPKYDLMNDFMSFGLHRLWKRTAIQHLNLRQHHTVLDLAGGTGDLTLKINKRIGANGHVILSDINQAMLAQGRDRLLDQGITRVEFALANAETLPFQDNSIDRLVIAFGLRNVTDQQSALASMQRVLKPGGKAVILEFSKPVLPLLSKLYDRYSFNVIPKLGEWVCNDKASYQYLVESIRKHPDQTTLCEMMSTAGFDYSNYHNLSAGIVALHYGYKY